MKKLIYQAVATGAFCLAFGQLYDGTSCRSATSSGSCYCNEIQ